MQVILSDKEYKNLTDKVIKLEELEDKLKQVMEIEYDNDDNIMKGIYPTVVNATINKDKLIDVLPFLYRGDKEQVRNIIIGIE